MYQHIKPYIAVSAILHTSCTSIEDLEKGVLRKFELKLEEMTFVQQQVALMSNLLNEAISNLEPVLLFEEARINEDNLSNFSSKVKTLQVILTFQ